MKNKIKELESLLATWKAVRDDLKKRKCFELVKDIDKQIFGAKTALRILKKPSNTKMQTSQKPCLHCEDSYNENRYHAFCGFCGMAFDR